MIFQTIKGGAKNGINTRFFWIYMYEVFLYTDLKINNKSLKNYFYKKITKLLYLASIFFTLFITYYQTFIYTKVFLIFFI